MCARWQVDAHAAADFFAPDPWRQVYLQLPPRVGGHVGGPAHWLLERLERLVCAAISRGGPLRPPSASPAARPGRQHPPAPPGPAATQLRPWLRPQSPAPVSCVRLQARRQTPEDQRPHVTHYFFCPLPPRAKSECTSPCWRTADRSRQRAPTAAGGLLCAASQAWSPGERPPRPCHLR